MPEATPTHRQQLCLGEVGLDRSRSNELVNGEMATRVGVHTIAVDR